MHATADQLTDEGIAALRAGERARARDLLERAVQLDAQHVRAWLWLSGVVDSPNEQRFCLEQVLALDPQHEAAQRGLNALTADPAPPPVAAPPPAGQSSAGASTIRLPPLNHPAIPLLPPFSPADRDDLAFVITALQRHRRRNEVIRQLAERRQLSWDDAQQFVARVEMAEGEQIARGQRQHWWLMLGIVLLGILGVVLVVVVLLLVASVVSLG